MKDIIGNIALVVFMGALALGVLNAVVIFAGFILKAISA